MIDELAWRRLDVDLLARELGNWRTSSASGPAYQGLADGLRMLIVDGRLPVGAQLPSERALADALRVSRTTVTAAYTQMRDDGYLNGRRGARSTTALPVVAPTTAPIAGRTALTGNSPANLAAATLSAPAAAVSQAFAEAAQEVAPYLHDIGIELVGVPPLREAIAERYCARGLPTEPDEIVVTTGALNAIGLILATYTQPGDRVLVEQPTYHGALAAMASRGVRPVPVAMTHDGWELDAVDAAVRQLSPSLAYLIPDNHNPTGMTLPPAGRRRLAHIIAETRTRTIVDETITDMWLDEAVPPPLAASMTSRRDLVLTVGSMSKSCWGGLRIGWI
ncbi:MAG: PLP-dependent aminotransferase family protein, partial [Mycobacterium sp.]